MVKTDLEGGYLAFGIAAGDEDAVPFPAFRRELNGFVVVFVKAGYT